MASKSQLKATRAHRRRAAARGLVRVEVQALKKDAELIRALAEKLRGESEKAETLRAALTKVLNPPKTGTAFDIFGSDLPDEAFEGELARGRSVKFLLDTSIISEIRKRDRAHPNVARWVNGTPSEEIGTSVVVLAEIRRGIELKRRRDPQQAVTLDRWFLQMRTQLDDRVLPVDESVAEAWALLGIPDPLPLIDGLLAATAKVHGLTIVTRNVAAPAGVPFLDPFSD